MLVRRKNTWAVMLGMICMMGGVLAGSGLLR